MTEARYNFEAPAYVAFNILQGVTFCKRWRFRFGGQPFPFFSSTGQVLWKGRCMLKTDLSSDTPNVSLTSEDNGVTIDTVDGEVFYGLYISATQTAYLPIGKLLYDIEFERLTDGWVIRPQSGSVTVHGEVTR